MSTVGTIIADETHTVSIPEQGTEQRKSGDLRTGGICVPIDRQRYAAKQNTKIPK